MAGSPAGHLTLINCIIGLAMQSPTWPHPLSDYGFKPFLIGQRYRVSRSGGSIVKPDITLRNFDESYVLITEAKSGKTIDFNQIQKCELLSRDDIASHVSVAVPSALRHEVVLVCYDHEYMFIADKLTKMGVDLPIIVISNKEIIHLGEKYKYEDLNKAFQKPLPITSEMAIPAQQYVPFDSDSELGDIADYIMPYVLGYMREQNTHFSTSMIVSRIFGSREGFLSDDELTEARRAIGRVLNVAATKFMREYIRQESGRQESYWTIHKNPFDMDPSQQSKSLEAFKRRSANLIAHLKGEPWPPEQLQFKWNKEPN